MEEIEVPRSGCSGFAAGHTAEVALELYSLSRASCFLRPPEPAQARIPSLHRGSDLPLRLSPKLSSDPPDPIAVLSSAQLCTSVPTQQHTGSLLLPGDKAELVELEEQEETRGL